MTVQLDVPAIAGAPAPAPEAVPLAAWRRLDWRLLLPVGELGVVVHVGEPEAGVAGALRELARELRVVPAKDLRRPPAPGEAPADKLVLAPSARPHARDLAAARARLRPGGWLVAPVARPGLRPAPRALTGCCRMMRRAGFADVAAHWHAPSFEVCSYVVALEDRAAVRAMLARHQGVRFGLAKSLAARALLAAGAVEVLARSATVVARRPEDRDR